MLLVMKTVNLLNYVRIGRTFRGLERVSRAGLVHGFEFKPHRNAKTVRAVTLNWL